MVRTVSDAPLDSEDGTDAIEVRPVGERGRGLFARRSFQPGETVARSRRLRTVPERHTHSMQIDWDVHIEIGEPIILMNHSCDPNTGIRNNQLGAYDFVAIRPIEEGEELTMDYAMSEYESMSVPFCGCGAATCRGRAIGYKDLDAAARTRYGALVADYLKGQAPRG